MKLRKIVTYEEICYMESGKSGDRPVKRVCSIGIIKNPFSGSFEEDLTILFDLGEELGAKLAEIATGCFVRPVVSYGKAALIGVDGDIEHAHAMLHPKLGKQMRGPIGGGEALIPSSAKIGGPGCSLDIPLGHKDDAWSFDHFDAMTVVVPDAPRPDEMALAIAFADGGRLNPRCGGGRAAK